MSAGLRHLLGAGWRFQAEPVSDDALRDACITAALPFVLTQCSCRGDWEDTTVARRCIELADAIVVARNRA